MAKAFTIKAKPRESKKPNALRASGFVPATVYGHGFKSVSVQVNAKEFSKVPHRAYSHLNNLEIEGGETYPILIRDVQVDPVRDNFLNIEFYRIRSDEKITVKVALNYAGHSPAVTAGGVLIVSMSEIEIQCLPKDIPDVVDVNLEDIKEIGQSIQVKDLKISEDIQVLSIHTEVLVKVEVAKTHEIEEAVPVAAAVTPEAATEAAATTAATPEAAKASAKEPQKTEQKPAKK